MTGTERCFQGPLFVIGMPRSGTKLLRDLLNNHSDIGIPEIETHFLPRLILKYGNPPDARKKDVTQTLLSDIRSTGFFWHMKRRGHIHSLEDIDTGSIQSWSDLMSPIIQLFAPKRGEDIKIWGDKTPGYLFHIPLLKDAFPAAKFIHIIRDPRDYCISVRNAWGQSLLRAACRWKKGVRRAREDGAKYNCDYFEVKYESLIERPERTMSSICDFIGIDYQPSMVSLNRPSENIGDAKGRSEIISGNKGKFFARLKYTQIKRIEEIVYNTMNEVGYDIEYAKDYKPLNRMTYYGLLLLDGYKVLAYHAREKGIMEGIWYAVNLKRDNWRVWELG